MFLMVVARTNNTGLKQDINQKEIGNRWQKKFSQINSALKINAIGLLGAVEFFIYKLVLYDNVARSGTSGYMTR